jgi:hypothetical protein
MEKFPDAKLQLSAHKKLILFCLLPANAPGLFIKSNLFGLSRLFPSDIQKNVRCLMSRRVRSLALQKHRFLRPPKVITGTFCDCHKDQNRIPFVLSARLSSGLFAKVSHRCGPPQKVQLPHFDRCRAPMKAKEGLSVLEITAFRVMR